MKSISIPKIKKYLQQNTPCCVCGEIKWTRFFDDLPYCSKHYQQMKFNGEIIKPCPHLVVIKDDFAEVTLYNRKNEEVGKTLVDLDDLEKVKDIKWYLKKDGYAISCFTSLSHFILDFNSTPNLVVDHINRNRLDNRKSNLRIVDCRQNTINRSKQYDNTSGIVGVCWDKEKNKYRAFITLYHKIHFLGYFDDIKEAEKIRKKAEITYFGAEINRDFDVNAVHKN
jgi:hypothetical protein